MRLGSSSRRGGDQEISVVTPIGAPAPGVIAGRSAPWWSDTGARQRVRGRGRLSALAVCGADPGPLVSDRAVADPMVSYPGATVDPRKTVKENDQGPIGFPCDHQDFARRCTIRTPPSSR